jgi:hypothetical protein
VALSWINVGVLVSSDVGDVACDRLGPGDAIW